MFIFQTPSSNTFVYLRCNINRFKKTHDCGGKRVHYSSLQTLCTFLSMSDFGITPPPLAGKVGAPPTSRKLKT